MSFDYSLGKPCDHFVYQELLGVDYQTRTRVNMPKALANNKIKVYVDGVEIPEIGLYSEAKLYFGNPGPYRFIPNESDLLYLALGDGNPVYIQMLTGTSIRTDDVVKDLQVKIPNLKVYNESNHVIIQNGIESGLSGFRMVDPRLNGQVLTSRNAARVIGAYAQAGISPGKVINHQKVYPGWSLNRDYLTFEENKYIIEFERSLPNKNPVVKVSYYAQTSACRRCNGSGYEYDYTVKNNTYSTSKNGDLLVQEFDKFLFTKSGSHFKWKWIGSDIQDQIGTKLITRDSTGVLSLNIDSTFQTYSDIKAQQLGTFRFQNVTDEEYPGYVADVTISTDAQDPTLVSIIIDITDKTGKVVTVSRIVEGPNAVSPLTNPDLALRAKYESAWKFRA